MAQNIVVSLFPVESEGYQALTELKQNPGGESSYVSAAALVKKENGTFRTLDGFDTGSQTMDDMAIGGLVGALFGILGGPIGILLGGSYGALIGSAFDTDDALMGASMLEQIADKMVDGEVAVAVLLENRPCFRLKEYTIVCTSLPCSIFDSVVDDILLFKVHEVNWTDSP